MEDDDNVDLDVLELLQEIHDSLYNPYDQERLRDIASIDGFEVQG